MSKARQGSSREGERSKARQRQIAPDSIRQLLLVRQKNQSQWNQKVKRSKASDDQWELFAAQLEGERGRERRW